MTTHHEQNNLESPQTDPHLDALLDRAVSAGSPPAPPASPDLTQRILDQTTPMLDKGPVVAKIGPSLMRIAAAAAIVIGAGLGAYVLTDDASTGISNPDGRIAILDPSDLPADVAIETGNTQIDEQLDVLSLRVELVSAEAMWSSVDTDTNSLMDQAVTGYELDQFSQDVTYLWADESALF